MTGPGGPSSGRDRPRPARRGGRGSPGPSAARRQPDRPRREADPARRVALEALLAVTRRDAYANLVLPALLRRAGLSGRDAAFATELTYGTLRGRGSYDPVLAACVDRPLAELDPELLEALRLGAHQLLALRVPPHAAVAATVDLVRGESGPGAAGLANAVLRRVAAADLDTWTARVAPDPGTDPDGYLAVRCSHPEWIVRALRGALRANGRDPAELTDLLDADNHRPGVSVTALPGLAEPAELVAAGAAHGALAPLAVTVTGAPEDVRAVREGRARVQDEGSQLVALALAAVPVDDDRGRWLDLCAGPGGKAALLAAELAGRRRAGRVGDGARLVAVEPVEHRAELVRGALRPVTEAGPGAGPGVGVEVRRADGREAGAAEPGGYDRVLVDVPCTGLGALRRRPEARWRRSPADLSALAPLQRALLASALDAVRPGGVVAYATCSPHPAETRLVVDDVLARRPDVERLDAGVVLGGIVRTGQAGAPPEFGPGPEVQLWPHAHGTDAMFLALLRRV